MSLDVGREPAISNNADYTDQTASVPLEVKVYATPIPSKNYFRSLWDNGYTRIVPVVPVGAEISPRSTLNRPGSVGKAVGIRGSNGLWFGYDWVGYENDEDDLERWSRMGADIGLKGGPMPDGTWFLFLDADTKNPELAAIIEQHVEAMAPGLPKRIGQAPKAAFPIRVSGEYRYSRIEFGERNAKGELSDRLELLSEGRYTKVRGIHPGTGEPYYWPRKLVPFHELPVVTPQRLTQFMDDLRAVLPAASEVKREGSSAVVNQESLRGDPERVHQAVALIPNTSDRFPTRDTYRDFGYAIKAALPDDEPAAFALFEEWCQRWDGGENDPRVIESDWRRMKPPFRVGAGRLYELAEACAPDRFVAAERWFDPNALSATIGEDGEQVPAPAGASDVFEVLSLGEIINRPPTRFIVARHIPEGSLGFLYGAPSSGKSFVVLDLALHIAFGKPDWHGDAIESDPSACVLYLAGEGALGFRTRARAWAKRHGIPEDEIDSGRFRLLPVPVNMMRPGQVEKLVRTIRHSVGRVCLIVVDTVSRSMPGADENLQKEMTLFVEACDVLKRLFGCVVLGVHHANNQGRIRGSNVLPAGGDFVFKLTKTKGSAIRTLYCEKQKDGPDDWSDLYRFDAMEVEGGSSLVPFRHVVADIQVPNTTPDLTARVLEAMTAAWVAKDPWAKTNRARNGRYAGTQMARLFGIPVEKAEPMLKGWVAAGMIAVEEYDTHGKREGYRVLTYITPVEAPAVPPAGVFS